jgi:hypothetical protein
MAIVEAPETCDLVLFDAGIAQEAVNPTNLVEWHRLGNWLTVVVRHPGAVRPILMQCRVPVVPGNERAPVVLASWIPASRT